MIVRALRRAGPLGIGAALVGVYVLAVTGTLPLGRNVRPLFEGIGPPPAYRWVKPPAAFAAGNVPPKPSDTDIPMTPTGSQQAGAQSEDNQLVINMAPNAAPTHPPDTSVRIHIEPVDPATLAPLPPDVKPNGNDYLVTLTYQPSGAPVPALAAQGNILLTVPLSAAGMYSSPDGRTWTKAGVQTVAGQPIVGGPFTASGHYLAATHPTPPSSGGGGGGSGVIIVAALVGGLALVLGLFPVVRRRLRRPQQQPQGQRPKAAAKRPQQRQRPRKRRR